MTAQANVRVKAQSKPSKEVQHLFRQHPIYGRVFSPWGAFGAIYAVESEAEYQRICESFSPLYKYSGLYAILFNFVYRFLPLNLIGSCLVAFAGIFLIVLTYARKVEKIARQLRVAEARPPLLVGMRRSACAQPLWRLWLGSTVCSLFSGGLCLLALRTYGDEQIFLGFFVGLFALLALTCSLMIVLRELPPTHKARISRL